MFSFLSLSLNIFGMLAVAILLPLFSFLLREEKQYEDDIADKIFFFLFYLFCIIFWLPLLMFIVSSLPVFMLSLRSEYANKTNRLT